MTPRIIVLEDDEQSRQALSRVLEQRGYEVVSAAEPLGCCLYTDLESPCTHEFPCGDFLLTDNRMPGMTGLEFIARQKERGCKGVVHNKAILSGTWEDWELESARQLGCQVFTKPCTLQEILRWLEEREATLAPDRRLTDLGPG